MSFSAKLKVKLCLDTGRQNEADSDEEWILLRIQAVISMRINICSRKPRAGKIRTWIKEALLIDGWIVG